MRLSALSRLVAAPLALVVGCTTAPTAYVTGRATPERLVATPSIVAQQRDITLDDLSSAEREAYNRRRERRQQRIDEIDNKELGVATASCIIGTLIILSPLCLIIVPVIYPMGRASARAGANLGPPLPPLPSHDDVVGVYEQIKNRKVAAKVADRMASMTKRVEHSLVQDAFPRLILETTSAGLSLDGQIFVDFCATAEAGPGGTSAPTTHRFYFDYSRSKDQVTRELDYAEQELAKMLWSEYALESLQK